MVRLNYRYTRLTWRQNLLSSRLTMIQVPSPFRHDCFSRKTETTDIITLAARVSPFFLITILFFLAVASSVVRPKGHLDRINVYTMFFCMAAPIRLQTSPFRSGLLVSKVRNAVLRAAIYHGFYLVRRRGTCCRFPVLLKVSTPAKRTLG